jgi:hypothetical protein
MLPKGNRHEKDYSISIAFDSSANGQWTAPKTGYGSKRDTAVNELIDYHLRRAFKELMDQKGWEMPDILMEQETLIVNAE